MRPEKRYAIEEFQRNLKENSCVILTGYTGISSEQLNAVRAELDHRNGKYQVVKKRLFSIAASEIGMDGVSALLDGQVGVVYTGEEHSIDVLKYLVKFKKDNNVLKLLGGILKGNKYNGKELETLSYLPSREVMRARVAAAFQSPLSSFARVLRSRLLSVLYVINAIVDKRKEEGDAAAASE